MNDIRYKWNDGLNSVQISADVSLPEFKVIGHRTKRIEASLSTGNYSRLAVEIGLTRSHGYQINSMFLPAALFNILAFMSFLISGPQDRFTRLFLCIMALVLLTLMEGLFAFNGPKISYIKKSDVYMGCSSMFAFLALLGKRFLPPDKSVKCTT